MADALKTFFSRGLVRRLGLELKRAEPGFALSAFVAQATKGLDELELLDRGKHIARALREHLPVAYPDALEIVLRSLGPKHQSDELVGAGMAPFFYLPHTLFVAEHGLGHFDLSMQAQYELTQRFTAESSIRPYIAQDPERTFAVLASWAKDDSAHVRRLVSEGTRLRLPWAMRVQWLDRNPERVVALLELLKDDAASVVRRSVANNLNDLGKLHPELLVATSGRWLAGASKERRALVEHALRSAVKRAEPGALSLLGFGKAPGVAVERVRVTPKRVAIGKSVKFEFVLRSTKRSAQTLLVDLQVHCVKAKGNRSPKVFKLDRVELPAGGEVQLHKQVSLAVHTTRKPYPGRHLVFVLVNGQPFELGAFDVVGAA
jgi:3-methyladenine DNA glycosylase AlkC